MVRQSYTAKELFCMAYIQNKQKMYGIPDGFGAMPREMRIAEIQRISDGLTDEGIIEMDMDGSVELNESCKAMLDYICECDMCLTLNVQKSPNGLQSYMFWQHNSSYMMAEVIGDRYLLSTADAFTIRGLVEQAWDNDKESSIPDKIIVPQLALVKAKRRIGEEKTEDAFRILRQNGADEKAAQIILSGLSEKAGYLGVLLMDNHTGECKKQEYCYLFDNDVIFALSQQVLNFRTCAVFSGVDSKAVQETLTSAVDNFLK